MTRTIFIDPTLKGQSGHHLRLSIELSKAAATVGHEPVWLAHKALAPGLVPDFVRFVPAFSSGIYERQIGLFGRMVRPLVGDRRFLRSTLAERNWEIRLRRRVAAKFLDGDRCRELIAALNSEKPDKKDHLVIHSADTQTLDMLDIWAARQTCSELPAIHVRTCWSRSNMPFADYCGGFSQVLRRLSERSRVLTVSAETPAGARRLASESGLSVGVSRYLVDDATLNLPPRATSSDPLIVGWLGSPRPEKGTDIIPDIIRTVLAARPQRPIKFLLQCAGRTSRKARLFDERLAEFGESVEQIPVDIPQEAYLMALSRCDILLLPYDADAYPSERGSGAAVEALLTGKPIAATAGTFAADLITSGNGLAGSDAASIGSCLLQIGADYSRYHAGALVARERARQTYDRVTNYRQLIGQRSERPVSDKDWARTS